MGDAMTPRSAPDWPARVSALLQRGADHPLLLGDIAEALAQELGHEIDRRLIQLEEPIKQVGRYQVPLRLARDVMPTVTVVVEGEAP